MKTLFKIILPIILILFSATFWVKNISQVFDYEDAFNGRILVKSIGIIFFPLGVLMGFIDS